MVKRVRVIIKSLAKNRKSWLVGSLFLAKITPRSFQERSLFFGKFMSISSPSLIVIIRIAILLVACSSLSLTLSLFIFIFIFFLLVVLYNTQYDNDVPLENQGPIQIHHMKRLITCGKKFKQREKTQGNCVCICA